MKRKNYKERLSSSSRDLSNLYELNNLSGVFSRRTVCVVHSCRRFVARRFCLVEGFRNAAPYWCYSSRSRKLRYIYRDDNRCTLMEVNGAESTIVFRRRESENEKYLSKYLRLRVSRPPYLGDENSVNEFSTKLRFSNAARKLLL